FISFQPAQRANGTGCEYQAIAVTPARTGEPGRECSRDGHAAGIVVGERRMAYVREHQYFIAAGPRQEPLPVRQRSHGKATTDFRSIHPIDPTFKVRCPETESPITLVIAGAIRNPIRILGRYMQMRTQLPQLQRLRNWFRIADQMKIVCLEVDDLCA